MLYIPEHQYVNMTSIRAHSKSTVDGVNFKLVYLGAAIEFPFSAQHLHEDVVKKVLMLVTINTVIITLRFITVIKLVVLTDS